MSKPTAKIINWKEFDPSRVKLGGFKTGQNNFPRAQITYDGESCFIMTPALLSIMGFRDPFEESSNKYTFQASFPHPEFIDFMGATEPVLPPEDHSDYESVAFFKKIYDVEQVIKKQASESSLEVFKKGKKLSVEAIEEYHFFPVIKYSADKVTKVKDGKYAPTIKFKFPAFEAGSFKRLKLFDNNLNPLPPTKENMEKKLHKGVRFMATLNFDACYMSGGKISPSFVIERIRTHSREMAALPECPFGEAGVAAPEAEAGGVSVKDDDEDYGGAAAAPPTELQPQTLRPEDDDGDDEGSEDSLDEAEAPAPAPAPVPAPAPEPAAPKAAARRRTTKA